MRTTPRLVLAAFALLPCSAPFAQGPAPPTPGALFIVGGGKISDSLRREAIALAGGARARVAIFAQASREASAGPETAKLFDACGAGRVDVVELGAKAKAREVVANATLIWFGGGSQNRLMDELRRADLVEAIQARWRKGAVVGGTSAGAAVMSKLMITGDEYERGRITAGSTALGEGLGFLPDAIVDQHFVARGRFPRLLAAVLEHPDQLGIGIDESTAAIVEGDSLRVSGDSHVLVFDAREANCAKSARGELAGAENLRLHLLRPGDTLHMRSR